MQPRKNLDASVLPREAKKLDLQAYFGQLLIASRDEEIPAFEYFSDSHRI